MRGATGGLLRGTVICLLLFPTLLGQAQTEGELPVQEVEEGESVQDSTAPPGQETEISARPDVEAALYLNRCSGCHTVGGGDLAGPDLAPSTAWPRPDLEQAVRRMQRNVGPMTEEEIGALVDFMKSSDISERLAAERERFEAQFRTQAEPGSMQTGRALFTGRIPLENRGMACVGCHQISLQGGTLAIALDGTFERMGETALISAIQQSSFRIMRSAYLNHPVTRQEAIHLTAYLEKGEIGGTGTAPYPSPYVFGGGVAALALASMALLYRQRNRGVRQALLARVKRS